MRESIKLGESTYYVRVMPPFDGLRVLGDLQAKFGPALSELLEDGFALSGPALSAAATRLSLALPGAELERIARMLLDPECVSVEGKGEPAVKLDAVAQAKHLRGPHDIVSLALFVAQVNFRPFYSGDDSLIGRVRSLLPPKPSDASALN